MAYGQTEFQGNLSVSDNIIPCGWIRGRNNRFV